MIPELIHTEMPTVNPFASARLFAAMVVIFLVVCVWTFLIHPFNRGSIEPLALNHRIDVNVSDAQTLRLLPGIGPQIARRIVENRQTAGLFRIAVDLERVRSIGPHIRARIEPFIMLGTEHPTADTAGPSGDP